MRKFELKLGDIVNESVVYGTGRVKCYVSGIRAGKKLLLWVKSLEELGHKDMDGYVAWMTKKAGYVEVSE